jgi:hypothetical protein
MILNFVRALSSGKGAAKPGAMQLSAADSLINAAVILLRFTVGWQMKLHRSGEVNLRGT